MTGYAAPPVAAYVMSYCIALAVIPFVRWPYNRSKTTPAIRCSKISSVLISGKVFCERAKEATLTNSSDVYYDTTQRRTDG